jgi:hypothetical protein
MPVKTDRTAVWGVVWLEQLWQDLRYGCRMLAANPGFTIVAVISLALGIGANCAIFTWTDALLLRPLPVARPGEVLTVGSARMIPRMLPAWPSSTSSSPVTIGLDRIRSASDFA